MTELRVVIPDDVAECLASEAAQQGTTTEDVAAEVLTLHVPTARPMPGWIGAYRSGRDDVSERHKKILKDELGRGA